MKERKDERKLGDGPVDERMWLPVETRAVVQIGTTRGLTFGLAQSTASFTAAILAYKL